MSNRRFTPPWSVEEAATCFIARDSAGHKHSPIFISRMSPAGDIQPRQHILGEVPARCRDQGSFIHARVLRVPHTFVRKIFRAGLVVRHGGIHVFADALKQKVKRSGHSSSPEWRSHLKAAGRGRTSGLARRPPPLTAVSIVPPPWKLV
jgi:hypothetical protein